MASWPGTCSPRSIDHLVIAVADLDGTAQIFECIGFTLTPRAHHPWGTDNRLIQLSDRSFIGLPGHAPEGERRKFAQSLRCKPGGIRPGIPSGEGQHGYSGSGISQKIPIMGAK